VNQKISHPPGSSQHLVNYSNIRFETVGVRVPFMYIKTVVKRFRGGLVVKAHRLLYHSTLGLRVIKKRRRR